MARVCNISQQKLLFGQSLQHITAKAFVGQRFVTVSSHTGHVTMSTDFPPYGNEHKNGLDYPKDELVISLVAWKKNSSGNDTVRN